MMKCVRIACAGVLALVVSGCALPIPGPTGQQLGRPFDIETARAFVHGVSTKSDVRDGLGEPTQVFYEQDGQEVWQYQFGDLSFFTRDYAAGGYEMQEAYFMFDGDVLADSQVSSYSTPITRY